MHFVRGLITIGSSLLVLAALQASVLAQVGLTESGPHQPQDETPLFTQLLTVTVETGAPTATVLFSRWDNAYLGFPVGPDGISFSMLTPSDSTEITASVQHGSFEVIGTTVFFTLTESSDFSWSYRTAQKVSRTGNQFQIDQFARSNNFFRYIGTVFYPPPYQYVGSITFTPQLVTSDTLYWDLIVPLNTQPNRHVFQASSWLVDPRLDQPDLSFTSAAMSIQSGLNPPIAYLTATLRNNNDVNITSTNAFLEFYDRASPSVPPGGPLDHDGGWCGTGAVPDCPALPTFSNPIPALAPGASTTVFMTYPLTRPGLRDYYFQIDTFGGSFGLNYEFNETNNIYTLTQGATIDYLAGIVISGPLTGTAHTPYVFEALVTPDLAISRPLTYTWSPAPISGQSTAQATYAWADGLPHSITVTARNLNQIVVTGTHLISIEVPLSSASISGPMTVSRDIPHAYQVSALPITATLPVNYLWNPEPDQGQHTAVATYTLTGLGAQLLTVQLNNPIGPAITVTHAVTSMPALAAVAINGPSTGRPDTTYLFAATIDPAEVALPVDYVWSPAPSTGQGTAQAAYRWSTPGSQVISVTARNDSGPVTGTHAISINIPLTGVSIDGPNAVSVDIAHTYTATTQPPGATQPAFFLWSPAPDQGQGAAVVTYTLSEPGPHLLTVELTDSTGQPFSAMHTVTAALPLTAVTLAGPLTGFPQITYFFTATIDPIEAAPPLFNWSPVPNSGQGTAQAAYRWASIGLQTITVTAHNDSGSVTGQISIEITGSSLYLPLIRK